MGPSFPGKTYLIRTKLKIIFVGDTFITAALPNSIPMNLKQLKKLRKS